MSPLKALLSIVNESNEIVAWVCLLYNQLTSVRTYKALLQRFCQSQANGEIGEVLEGLKKRCEMISVPYPEMVVADNCCHVRSEVVRCLPSTDVVLDVYHFMMRYVYTSKSNAWSLPKTTDTLRVLLVVQKMPIGRRSQMIL
jgi:hypothetical protein